MKNIGILGSTGSIGIQALDVIKNFPDNFKVEYLTANENINKLAEQTLIFKPNTICIVNSNKKEKLESLLKNTEVTILSGREGLLEIASQNNLDLSINALVGAAGMEPTIEVIKNGTDIALSNKESMVMAGEIINNLLSKNSCKLFPIDSEHSAIWQCLKGEKYEQIEKIILTASGGPFRTKSKKEFDKISLKEALTHPNWVMGNKITIDSATMMNKGLEVIEAHWLFNIDPNEIDIVVHPESIIHSMVEFIDGSIKAQLGVPDMKVPIQYALTYPNHSVSKWERLDLTSLGKLHFEKPDLDKFRCIHLAYEAIKSGGTTPVVLNVANDIVVDAFLNGYISFIQIPIIIENALNQHENIKTPDLETITHISDMTINYVNNQIKSYA